MTPLVSVREAAKYLGVADDTVRAYERAGLLPSVRYPSLKDGEPRRRRLFTIAALDAFIAGHTSGQNSESEQPETVENKAKQKHGQTSKKTGNVHWLQQYARK